MALEHVCIVLSKYLVRKETWIVSNKKKFVQVVVHEVQKIVELTRCSSYEVLLRKIKFVRLSYKFSCYTTKKKNLSACLFGFFLKLFIDTKENAIEGHTKIGII